MSHAINASSADAERLGDSRGHDALRFHLAHLGHVDGNLPALADASGLGLGNASELGRSQRSLVSYSANTPSMSRRHLPAAAPVSIGCSVAFNEAPRGLHRVRDILQVTNAAR